MNKRIPIFFGMILICIAVWLSVTPARQVRQLIGRLDNLSYDLQLRTRIVTKHAKPSTPVAIIDIDDKSLKAVGRWPWPRSKVAELVDALQKQEAAIIAFDVSFSEKE